MTLSSALSNALSGLGAATRQVDVTANNIANATTEGYSRRTVELSSISLNGSGSGVRVAATNVVLVENLTNDRRRAEGELGRQTTLTEGLQRLENLVGDTEDPGSLFNRYQLFETSLRRLSDQPESTAIQLDVVNQAKSVIEGYNQIQRGVNELRENADREIARQVTRLNDALNELSSLNAQVLRDNAIDRDPSEAIAARENVINDIASIVPVKTRATEDGQIKLFTVGGAALVDLTAADLSFAETPVITPDQDLRNGAGVLSGLSLNGVDVTPGVAAFGGFDGGSLDALFDLRDGIGVEFQTQIDAIAEDLVNRFSDPAVEPGVPVGIFTDAGAASTGAAGLAGRLSLNAAVDPEAPGGNLSLIKDGLAATVPGPAGDNNHAIGLLGALTSAQAAPAASGVPGTKSSSDLIADFTSLVATRTESSETTEALRAARFNSLRQTEVIATGVDLDFELQNLTTLQNAYAANAQVIRVVDELTQLLLRN